MRPRKRTPLQILGDRRKVARAYLQGKPQRQIGEELKLSAKAVSDDLRAIQDEWRASALRDFDEAKAQELAKIDAVECEAWEAWQHSKKEQKRKTKKQKAIVCPKQSVNEKGEVIKTMVIVGDSMEQTEENKMEESAGEPKFLLIVLECIGKRCEIIGLNAPVKIEGTVKKAELQTDKEIDARIQQLLVCTGVVKKQMKG